MHSLHPLFWFAYRNSYGRSCPLYKNGAGIDKIPFDATIGHSQVISIKDKISITLKELDKRPIKEGDRLLFKTKNSSRCWNTDKFLEDFVYISEEAADYLARKKVSLVGVDYLSVGGYKADGIKIHRTLLSAGIWLIEGLNLSKVKPGKYELICLPLKLLGADGAPARAILKRLKK